MFPLSKVTLERHELGGGKEGEGEERKGGTARWKGEERVRTAFLK